MAKYGINRPPNPTAELFDCVDHGQWHADRISGTLRFRLETLDGQWVSPGTGRLSLAVRDDQPTVAEKAARNGDTPIIPGSSIKGAVRTVFELLTDSCNPLRGHGCTSDLRCPACTVFGGLGYRGRVSFDDATPSADDFVTVSIVKTPLPHDPDPKKTEGDFRFYDLNRWEPKPNQTPPPGGLRPLEREALSGIFVSRLRFHNLTRQALGAVVICMGCSTESWQRFPLRLGGVKYDGKGAVRVEPVRVRQVAPERRVLEGESLRRTIEEWVGVSNGRPWASRCKPTLTRLCEVLNGESGREGP